MTRTDWLKLAYGVVIAFAVTGVVVVAALVGDRPWWLLGFGLLFLAPGRIQGVAYREFFRGRNSLQRGDAAVAIQSFERFLAALTRHPSRKRLIWLAWTVYSTDIEAMTWNNIGAARSALRDFTGARQAFDRALAIDPLYPLPHVNVARIAVAEGNRNAAEQALAEAARLGYRGTSIDSLMQELAGVLARVEGR